MDLLKLRRITSRKTLQERIAKLRNTTFESISNLDVALLYFVKDFDFFRFLSSTSKEELRLDYSMRKFFKLSLEKQLDQLSHLFNKFSQRDQKRLDQQFLFSQNVEERYDSKLLRAILQ